MTPAIEVTSLGASHAASPAGAALTWSKHETRSNPVCSAMRQAARSSSKVHPHWPGLTPMRILTLSRMERSTTHPCHQGMEEPAPKGRLQCRFRARRATRDGSRYSGRCPCRGHRPRGPYLVRRPENRSLGRRRAGLTEAAEETVPTGPAVQPVVAGSTDESIVPESTTEHVSTAAAPKDVGSIAARKEVGCTAAREDVGSRPTRKGVRAGAAPKDVRAATADQGVGSASTDQEVVPTQAVEVSFPPRPQTMSAAARADQVRRDRRSPRPGCVGHLRTRGTSGSAAPPSTSSWRCPPARRRRCSRRRRCRRTP